MSGPLKYAIKGINCINIEKKERNNYFFFFQTKEYQTVTISSLLESGDLDEPALLFRVDLVVHGPFGQLVPLVERAAIHREPQLEVDILGVIQLNKHLLYNVGKVFSVDKVVCLHKDLSQSRLTNWVVFCIKLVKSVKCVSVLLKRKYDETKYCDMNVVLYRVTIQHVDGEVTGITYSCRDQRLPV